MAVSFNIPKSPKRDIFVIDNFQGVDYTNSGTNIDPSRSPNAPNMIRQVPGKVRKRMGYEKYIQFSQKPDVNFAKGTSSKEISVVFSPSYVGTEIKIYDTMSKIASEDDNPFTLYLEFDYKSTDDFEIFGDVTVPASEEWTHYSGSKLFSEAEVVEWVGITSATQQNVYIKNFGLLKERASGTPYVWSPAPVYFKEDELTNYVYGCHLYNTVEDDGSRIINVNRVLGTKDTFDTFNVTDEWSVAYQLANEIWRPNNSTASEDRTLVYVDFDYILTGTDNVIVKIASVSKSSMAMTPTSDVKHMSYTQRAGAFDPTRYNVSLKCATAGQTATVQIKNLSICYQKNDNYRWSKAPEDNGGTFPLEDVYFDSQKNYSEKDTYYDNYTGTQGIQSFEVMLIDGVHPNYTEAMGFAHMSFDLYAFSPASDLESITIEIRSCFGSPYTPDQRGYVCKTIVEPGNIINKHYDIYTTPLYTDATVNGLKVSYRFATSGVSRNIVTQFSNIEIRTISPREIYNNGISSSSYNLYHVGQRVYIKGSNGDNIELLSEGLARNRSWSQQLNDNLVFLDGKDIYRYKFGQSGLLPISAEDAYIPTVTISKEPSGGGTAYEPLNMLQPGFIEQFYVSTEHATDVNFQLSFGRLDSKTVVVWVLSNQGNWMLFDEGYHFTVNRGTGLVTFTTAPGASPIQGEDNVKIQAYRTVAGYRDRVAKCTFGTLFGVGGESDRLFLSGNPDYPNQDFYSQQNDITYFPDTGYSKIGSSSGAITGYARVNNYLATFKREADKSQSVVIREGDLITNNETGTSEPAFKIINTLQGEGAITPYAFGYMQTEPVFLTEAGIMAITAQDITGDKYSQNRSFYLNELLLKENNLSDAIATVFKDMYILSINSHLYILDGLQPVRTDRSEPYATRQYSAFYCTDIPATCIWAADNTLWFGTEDGKICRFHTAVDELTSYNDDGKPISAWWETPDLDGALFYKNKTFRYFAIRMMRALRTSAKLYSRKLSNWNFVKEDRGSGVVFDFYNIDFDNFSFSTDTSEKVVHTKLRVKKVDKARFRIENSRLNEPFGLFDLALEYVESGNYKR